MVNTLTQACMHHMRCILHIHRILVLGLHLHIWHIKVNPRRGSGPQSRAVTAGGARYVKKREATCVSSTLISSRFAAQASKLPMTDVVQTVSGSNKNAYSHRYRPKRKPSYQRILHTLIFVTPEPCRLNVVEDQYTLSKVSQPYTVPMVSL